MLNRRVFITTMENETMKNKDAASALRDLASRIDKLDPEQDLFSFKAYAHRPKGQQGLLDALSLRDNNEVQQVSDADTHWTKFTAAGVDVAVFFEPWMLGEVKEVEAVVIKQVACSISDLLTANETATN